MVSKRTAIYQSQIKAYGSGGSIIRPSLCYSYKIKVIAAELYFRRPLIWGLTSVQLVFVLLVTVRPAVPVPYAMLKF